MTKTRAGWSVVAMVVAMAAASTSAQERAVFTLSTPSLQIGNVEAAENVPPITGAPFTADAATEFTQTLSDGNRIEQRFSTSIARDTKGRTRREQQMALVGPLSVLRLTTEPKNAAAGAGGRGRAVWTSAAPSNEPQRYVVITDPVEHVSYTLYEQTREALRSPALIVQRREDLNTATLKLKRAEADGAGASRGPVVQDLGTRQIEGVNATGTRTTNTIPAGEIGNLAPINLVTERWFSAELGMAVLITRSDPRSGDTVYRLTNIVRAEPPPDLFTVPSDYKLVDSLDERKLQELKKLQEGGRGAGGRGFK
ncbi:MAG TPA: hypothetical protein VKB50_14290 [Vicinamibacterales bacterium]|nr:hypothetical protein [Vicinamibacterales bacterium]